MRLNWPTVKDKILIFMQNRQGLTSVYAYSDRLNGKPNAWGLSGYCLRKEPQEEFQTTWTISFFLYNGRYSSIEVFIPPSTMSPKMVG